MENGKYMNDYHRISMYEEILNFIFDYDLQKFALADVLRSLQNFYNELKESHNLPPMYVVEDKFRHLLHIPAKTVYYNPQNVHIFTSSAVNAANEIMKKYPAIYLKPFDHEFFDVLETSELVNGIHLPSLFASIWEYISTHENKTDLVQRMMEEIHESKDMCSSGCMIRMINSVRGFNDAFEFNLEEYEYNKATVFNILNKSIDIMLLENLTENISRIINSDSFRNETENIPSEDMLKILKDYTKCEWYFSQDIFYYL
nr:hypothetical protein 1DG000085 [Iridovirus CN01]UPA43839.1 hypothetical protein L2A02_0085 [Iridovirus CN01]